MKNTIKPKLIPSMYKQDMQTNLCGVMTVHNMQVHFTCFILPNLYKIPVLRDVLCQPNISFFHTPIFPYKNSFNAVFPPLLKLNLNTYCPLWCIFLIF